MNKFTPLLACLLSLFGFQGISQPIGTLDPVNSAHLIPTNQVFTVTFDQIVQSTNTAGLITLRTFLPGNSTPVIENMSIDGGQVVLTDDGFVSTLTITPTNPLPSGQLLGIDIPSGLFENTSNVSWSGTTGSKAPYYLGSDWHFTTDGGPCTSGDVQLEINFDGNPTETTIEVQNSSGTTVFGPSTGLTTYAFSLVQTPLIGYADDTYTLIFTDSGGDGMCCSNGFGSYKITKNGIALVEGVVLQSEQRMEFCIDSSVDATIPTITCPPSISIPATGCSASPVLANPTATDNVSTNFTFQATRSDLQDISDPFYLGITTISWTATDEAGNISLPCQQTITVTGGSECWTEVGAEFVGSAPNMNLGSGVSINAEGNIIAYADPNANGAGNVGNVLIYERSGNAWTLLGASVLGTRSNRSRSGIDLNDAGNRIAAVQGNGEVNVYDYDGTIWNQVGAQIPAAGSLFIQKLDFDATGNRLVVSYAGENSNQGLVVVYEYNGTNWVQLGGNLVGGAVGDNFGRDVSINSSGTRLAVGAPQFSSTNSPGYVKVFEFDGSSWQPLGNTMIGDGININNGKDSFGLSIGINDAGNRIVVGANAGRYARVYELQGATWTQIGSDLVTGVPDQIGYQVDINGIGDVVLLGSFTFPSRIFELVSSAWQLVGQIIYDDAGQDVAMNKAGDVIILGGPEFNSRTGKAVIYEYEGTLPPNPIESAVSLGTDGVLRITDIGATSDDAFTFTINGGNLEISNNAPLAVYATGGTQVDPNTISIPLSSLTGGITLNGGGGTNTLNLTGPLDLATLGVTLITDNIDISATGTDPISIEGIDMANGDLDIAAGTTVTVGTDADFFGAASLSGTGTLTGNTNLGLDASLFPGTSPGIINTGNLSLGNGSSFVVEIEGSTPGTEHDQTVVTGTVTINGATLSLIGGYANGAGDEIVIISNDDTDAVTGTFTGLAEGAPVSIGLFSGTITYVGGDGNDVVLVAGAPPPCPDPFVINTLYGTGQAAFAGDGDNAQFASFNFPLDIEYDAAGNMYILDAGNHVVRKIDAVTGVISTIAGTGGVQGDGGDGGPATSAQFWFPRAIEFDANGDLYVADANNNRIRKIDMTTGIITTVVGTGTGGLSGDGGLATAAEIFFPVGIVFNAAGEMFFTDSNNSTVRKVDNAGIITSLFPQGTFGLPQQMVLDANEDIYISDLISSTIIKIDVSNANSTSVFAGTTRGFSGDGGPATAAQLSLGGGNKLVFDAAGNLFFADAGNAAIRRIDASTGIITTIVGTGGVSGYSGDGIDPALATLNSPSGIIFDASGILRFADGGNHVIRGFQQICGPTLESRATLGPDGTLRITEIGTDSDDDFSFAVNGPNLEITSNGPLVINAPDGTQVNQNTVSIPLASITGNITINGGPGTNNFNLTGPLDLEPLNIGLITDNIDISATGAATISFDSLDVANGGLAIASGTTISLDPTHKAEFFADASLSGSGSIVNGTVVMMADATLFPGTSPGILTLPNLIMEAASILVIELDGPTPGTQYDRLNVVGTAVFNDPILQLEGGFPNAANEELVIVANDAADPISGIFDALPESTVVSVGDFEGTVTYIGGDGNDVALVGTGTPTDPDNTTKCILYPYEQGEFSVWIQNVPGVKDDNYYFLGNANQGGVGYYHIKEDGTARLTGTLVNRSDPTIRWKVDLRYHSSYNWQEWEALGGKYKVNNQVMSPGELALAHQEHVNWTYFMMDEEHSKFIGISGKVDGIVLKVMERSNKHRMQKGWAANDKDGDYGISGWFKWKGNFHGKQYSGYGDVNADIDCRKKPENDPPHNIMTTMSVGTEPVSAPYQKSIGVESGTKFATKMEIEDREGSVSYSVEGLPDHATLLEKQVDGKIELELDWGVNEVDYGIHDISIITIDEEGEVSERELRVEVPDPANFSSDLLYFELVMNEDHTAQLSWETTAELKGTRFVLEHSGNNDIFTQFHSQEGKGSIKEGAIYQHNDTRIINGRSFYRVKMILPSGSIKYSAVKVASVKENIDPRMRFFPNPANKLLEVRLPAESQGTYIVKMVDISGREVIKKTYKLDTGLNNLTIDISELSGGVYMIFATGGDGYSDMGRFTKN